MDPLNLHFLDQFAPTTLFLVNVAGMLLCIEIGYRISTRSGANHAKTQHSQVRAIMGASLGLTAFMLAFTFATAQSHYEKRVQLMLEETRLANDAFLDAQFMPEPDRSRAREMIMSYMRDRVRMADLGKEGRFEELFSLVKQAEDTHQQLWQLAVNLTEQRTANSGSYNERDPFAQAVVGLMDVQTARIEASLVNRISYVIWITLYLTGAFSMLIMGYQAGLVGRRSPVATVTLAVSFVTVMVLITDLDRPVMSLFEFDIGVIHSTLERMESMAP